MEKNELHVIRNHKDTVFRMLFKERKKLLELYNALNGTNYEDVEELEVLVININPQMNRALMEKCQTLREYYQFVDRIRTYASDMELTEAVDRAVTECIRENILKDFLTEQRAEAVLVLLEELGAVSEELRGKILSETRPDVLHQWLKEAAKAESVQEFLEQEEVSAAGQKNLQV